MSPTTLRRPVLLLTLAALAAATWTTGARASTSPDLTTGVVDITSTLPLEDGTSAGTGMMIRGDVVVTNHHVIVGAGRIVVRDVTTGRRYRATVVGYDAEDDVAVLRLAGSPSLGTVTVGNSASVHRGDAVTAVGNAGGVGGDPAVAPGTVTGLRQAITVTDASGSISERLTGLIRTNADIQEGDSGGPLFNALGRVIGMDTAASVSYGPGPASADDGYAIPINRAVAVARLILGGRASARVHIGPTARLGVQLQTAAGGGGALVTGVASGLPAARAGITGGDVIVSIAGRGIGSSDALARTLRLHHPGDRVRVVWVTPSGTREQATVRLATGPPT